MTKKASGCKVIFYKFFLYKICMMYTYFPIKMRIDDFACYRTSRETLSIDIRIYKVLSKDPGDKESRILYLYIFWKQIIIEWTKQRVSFFPKYTPVKQKTNYFIISYI